MYRDLDSDIFSKVRDDEEDYPQLTDRQDIKKFILYYDAGRRILVVKEKGKVIIDNAIRLQLSLFE